MTKNHPADDAMADLIIGLREMAKEAAGTPELAALRDGLELFRETDPDAATLADVLADANPADLLPCPGFVDADGNYQDRAARRWANSETGGILLFDEIDPAAS